MLKRSAKNTIGVLPSEYFGRPNTKSMLMDSQHLEGAGKLAMRGRMCQGFDPLGRITCAHISTYPLLEFGPPMTLANLAIGLLKTEMTANHCVMDLIDNSLVHFFTMRNNDVRGIRSIRAIAHQAVIDRISMQPSTRTCRQFNVRVLKLITSKIS